MSWQQQHPFVVLLLLVLLLRGEDRFAYCVLLAGAMLLLTLLPREIWASTN